MCRLLVLVAVALALSSPAPMAEASQAKPAQRPATKKPAPAKPATRGRACAETRAATAATAASGREDDDGVHSGRAGVAEHHAISRAPGSESSSPAWSRSINAI